MPKTLIRRATEADFPVLLEIDQASFAPGIAYDSVELSYFMKRRGAETLVLEAEGVIAAFLIIELRSSARAATIVTLDVRKTFRRLGFATMLLQASEELLRSNGTETWDLQVDVENHGAIAFYRKHGFEPLRVLNRYYSNGNDAYLMIKKLRPSAGA